MGHVYWPVTIVETVKPCVASGVYSRCRPTGSWTWRGDEVSHRGTALTGCREQWRSPLA